MHWLETLGIRFVQADVAYDFGYHDSHLVAVSLLVAATASRLFLELVARTFDAPNNELKALWLLASAFTLGGGIWAMHFIAMLAFHIPVVVHYAPVMTAVSMLLPVLLIALGIGWLDFSKKRHGRLRKHNVLLAGSLIGLSMLVMHYLGMAAMRSDADLYYVPTHFRASIAIALVAATGAFALAEFHRQQRGLHRWLAAGALTLAIVGMHYTAMAGTAILQAPANEDTLSLSITPGALILLGYTIPIVVAFIALLIVLSLVIENRLRKREQELSRSLDQARSFIDLYVRNSSDMLFIVDREQRILFGSPSIRNSLALDDQPIEGRTLADLLSLQNPLNPDAFGQHPVFSARDGEGRQRWLELRSEPVGDNGDAHPDAQAVIAVRDVTEAHAAHLQLRKLAKAVEQSADLILITDRNGIIEYVNDAFLAVTGYSREEAIGRRPSQLVKSKMQPRELYKTMWETLLAGRSFSDVIINRNKDGEVFYEQKTISPLTTNGEITHFISTGKDITERMQTQERMHELAYTDPITGLPNRVRLQDHLDERIRQSRRRGQAFALLLIDLDAFKRINDSRGHEYGDELLAGVAGRLQAMIDPETDFLARHGSDEFILITPTAADNHHVTTLAEAVLNTLREPFELFDQRIYSSASIGIVQFPHDGPDRSELLRNADAAMQQAKQLGKNRFYFYHQELNQAAAELLQLEAELHHALERGEFRLYLQPQVAPVEGRINGAEVLIRWQHGERGLVSPGDFIPLLEETGLIYSVGLWLLEETLQLGNRLAASLGEECPRLSINISPKQLMHEHFLADVRRLLATRPPRFELEMEITESLLMNDITAMSQTLHELQTLGVRIAVDDFGTGYSSLSYLHRLPLSVLKIDRQFIKDIPGSADALTISRAIIDMGHSLGLEIVAEGAEDAAQIEFLRSHEVELIQGFYYYRPMPRNEFVSLMKSARQAATAPA